MHTTRVSDGTGAQGKMDLFVPSPRQYGYHSTQQSKQQIGRWSLNSAVMMAQLDSFAQVVYYDIVIL
jgi:hypothetical protein